MGDGLLHLVLRVGGLVGPQPFQAPHRCTKSNSPPIDGHVPISVAVEWSVALWF